MASSKTAEAEDLSRAMAAVSLGPDDNSAAADPDPDPDWWVEIRPTETAGLGVFARRDIPRGTRIIAEAPLIMIPPGPDESSATLFCEALLRTPEANLVKSQ